MSAPATAPRSATHGAINLTGLLTSFAAAAWLLARGEAIGSQAVLVLIVLAYALPVMAQEAIWLRPGSLRLEFTRDAEGVRRVGTKLLGLAVTAALLAALYWLLPEYRGSFYDRFYAALADVLPWLAVAAVPYFFWQDAADKGRIDGYWQMGRVALLRFDGLHRGQLGQHMLGWLVKFFFLPLMFIYLSDKIAFYREYDFSIVFSSFRNFFDFAYATIFHVDLLVAVVGYTFTFRATDSHIRSAEPTLLGWMVALMCYQPFWSFFSAQYISYQSGRGWGSWLWDYPTVYMFWGSCILVLVAIYSWATLSFGLRFSNLTHRGIITNGPYRWCKHPAYVTKNLSYWMISMPYMVVSTPWEALRLCLLLLLLNGVYMLRARTEERHLSRDPVYCAYAEYMEENGMFRWVGRLVPALRFKRERLFNLPGPGSAATPATG